MVKMTDVHMRMENRNEWMVIFRRRIGLMLPVKYSRMRFYGIFVVLDMKIMKLMCEDIEARLVDAVSGP